MWNNQERLADYLSARLQRALAELSAMDPDDHLRENVDVVVAYLLGKHLPTPIDVQWDNPTAEPISEVVANVPGQFERDRTHTVNASKIVITYPVSGTTRMLDFAASTSSLSPHDGRVTDDAVVVEVVAQRLMPETIQAHTEQVRRSISQRVVWANSDLSDFEPTAADAVTNAYADRTERILSDRQVQAALEIPVRTTETPRPPVAAQRKRVTLEARRAQARFIPEPILEEATYREILATVRSWATSLERTPRTAAKLDEEELRDLLLGTLNGHWQGGAGGELFNGKGKTDVLIREGDRNALIAECKIWHGAKSVTAALDQLLSYLVWRDSKAALIIFIKTADPAATIAKIHDAATSHPQHVLTKDATTPTEWVDYLFTADNEGRRVSLAVVPVIVPATTP